MAQGRSVHLWPRGGRCIYGTGKVGAFMSQERSAHLSPREFEGIRRFIAFMAQGRSLHLWPREGRCIYDPGKVGAFMAQGRSVHLSPREFEGRCIYRLRKVGTFMAQERLVLYALFKSNPHLPQRDGCAKETFWTDIVAPWFMTVFNNIQDIQWYHTLYMLRSNVPMGWSIFSILTPVNINSSICPDGEGCGNYRLTSALFTSSRKSWHSRLILTF